eukprot:Lithocolla_globosa_v1_NODE_3_length_14236_cov_22.745998.p10 type:complete len:193 gc:universal NODE_3_length_14236_cov_22.745998:9890-9312(-)
MPTNKKNTHVNHQMLSEKFHDAEDNNLMEPCKASPTYSTRTVFQLRVFYVIAICLWLIFICLLGLQVHGWPGWVILSFPVLLSVVVIVCAPEIHPDIEGEMFKANFLSLGLIVAISLFAVLERNFKGNHRMYTIVVLSAVVASLLSLVYVWVPSEYLSLTRHFKSFMQTVAATLLIFAVYLFFRYSEDNGLS